MLSQSIVIVSVPKEFHIQLLSGTITINCGNMQTIRLVTKEIAKLLTKLRHVDVHEFFKTGRDETCKLEYL